MTSKIYLLQSLLLASFLLVGCGSAKIEDYASREPLLNLEKFFEGKLAAHGVVKELGFTAAWLHWNDASSR